MARVLIGWELGAGHGHIMPIVAVARRLRERGHDVALALQRFEGLPERLSAVTLFQAPVWPGLFLESAVMPTAPAVTMVDILARLGLSRPRTLTHLLLGWDAIAAAFRPDVVLCDHAPALQLAMQGRVPTIVAGSGFQVTPALDPVPRLAGDAPGHDEDAILDLIDADLREAGRAPLDSLGAMFRHDRSIIATFPLLDPYGRTDSASFAAPVIGEWAAPAEAPGNEVFVYLNGPIQRAEALWQGLAASGHPIRAYMPQIGAETRAMIERHGIAVERSFQPWRTIAKRSRLAVSHGGHGTLCAAMLAGIPHLVLGIDLEKRLHGQAMERAGFGALLDPYSLPAETLAAAVRSHIEDEDERRRIRDAAPALAVLMEKPFESAAAAAVEDLAQGS